MTFIEQAQGESDEELLQSIRALLHRHGTPLEHWTAPTTFRRTLRWKHRDFRELVCVAGSLHAWIWIAASKGWNRSLMTVGCRLEPELALSYPPYEGENLVITLIENGASTDLSPDEIQGL